eukprot:7090479-Prymnesium_polylepis.1
MGLALRSDRVDSVLYLDLDVAIVRNPFAHMPWVGSDSEVVHSVEFHLPDQINPANAINLGLFSHNANSGLMLVTSRERAGHTSFLRRVLDTITPTDYDQVVQNAVL